MRKMFAVFGVVALVLLPMFAAVAFAQEDQPWEPEKEAPGWITKVVQTVIGWFAPKYVVPFSVAIASLLIPVVALLRSGIAAFGSKLSKKQIWFATAILAFLTSLGGAGADGVLAGDELMMLATTAITIFAALLGYKITFSASAMSKYHIPDEK